MNCSSFNLPYTRPLGKNNLELFNLGQKATQSRSTYPTGTPKANNLDNLQP
ncbi:MAG: hypothetical protein F6K49_08465 [Moorea sp. SIO3I6]|uniref:hypothetical protein n=1 Tax=Moorena sp. SIO4A1 TaxID=2607835 RepID=UPI0013F9E554|nr:hypothetical protein [Moorena sp. SIO4A1]NEP22038.1 hypothetical protein [Moorena sp. SIO3I6]